MRTTTATTRATPTATTTTTTAVTSLRLDFRMFSCFEKQIGRGQEVTTMGLREERFSFTSMIFKFPFFSHAALQIIRDMISMAFM